MKSTTLVASLGLLGTTLAQSTTYACNPAHSYPNGATCVSTAGSLALVTPSVSASSSANVWPCNPAHKFPPGQSCVSSGSGYHLQQQTKSASKASASHTAGGVVYTTEVVTALTTYCPSSTTLMVNSKTYTLHPSTTLTVKNCPCTISKPVYAPPKSQHTRSANGTMPWSSKVAPTSKPTSSSKAVGTAPKPVWTAPKPVGTAPVSVHYTTKVYTALTTYCPSATNIVVNNKTMSIPSATTFTTSCPSGCTVTKPVTKSAGTAPAQSMPPADNQTYTTHVIKPSTVHISTNTTITNNGKTTAVSAPTTLTMPASTQTVPVGSGSTAAAYTTSVLPATSTYVSQPTTVTVNGQPYAVSSAPTVMSVPASTMTVPVGTKTPVAPTSSMEPYLGAGSKAAASGVPVALALVAGLAAAL